MVFNNAQQFSYLTDALHNNGIQIAQTTPAEADSVRIGSQIHALNDLIPPAFASAGIPAMKEPQGLSPSDGKRPDGLTLITGQVGTAVTWHVTVACQLADSYIHTAAQDAGAVAELAAARKTAKYAALESHYIFQPIAVETLGPINGLSLIHI